MAFFEIKELTFSYPGQQENALSDISLSIEKGQFVLFCGLSGSGKSTLLRHLKGVLVPHGKSKGTIMFDGKPLHNAKLYEQSSRIGFVSQNPDNQIVTDKVWHEIAFGLENLGYDNNTIRLRTAEMASYFGIQEWYHRPVLELSGGQKQMLNLASVMVMQPDVLILDEPTSQLDPIAASEIFSTLKKINDELGVTIILCEQRLEEVMPLSDYVIVMNEGRIIAQGDPASVGYALHDVGDSMLAAFPTPMRAYFALNQDVTKQEAYPITVREGRTWLAKRMMESGKNEPYDSADDVSSEQIAKESSRNSSHLSDSRQPLHSKRSASHVHSVMSLKDVWFRYERTGEDVLRGLSLEVRQGETFSLVGGNGTGKTTALKAMAGLVKPNRGRIRSGSQNGERVTLLPQDPSTVFTEKTIRADLLAMVSLRSQKDVSFAESEVERVAELVDIVHLLDRHPFDVSGGEQQRSALAKVLLTYPEILLLDEPTKGLDATHKQQLANIISDLAANGTTIVMVSHDVEYCAAHSDRCALFFDGQIVSTGETHDFFSDNSFYTTAANRMCRRLIPGMVTYADIVTYLKEH